MGDFSVINLSNAIRTVHTNVVTVSIQDESNYSAFDQDNNDITLDTVAITAEVTRLETEYDNNQYQRDRAVAYPSLQDQADMAYWDRKNGTTTLDDAIAAVKAEFPKP